MLPNFIGIGAPKAGTTWLARCLGEHPEIHVAPIKETKFFDDEQIEGRRAEYEAHFKGAGNAKAVGEISVRYLASRRGAAERIRQWLPDARLFVSLRNPVDQIWSHYWHLQRQNFHQGDVSDLADTVEEAVRRYPDLLIEPALYGKHLAHWLHVFDRGRLHVIFYDDIAARPARVVEGLYAFLGVDPAFRAPGLSVRDASVRRGTSPRTPWLGRAHRALYATLGTGLYGSLKRALGPRRADAVKRRLRVREIMEGVFMRSGYPSLPPGTQAHLAELVRDDVRRLEALVGRDLATWLDPAAGETDG